MHTRMRETQCPTLPRMAKLPQKRPGCKEWNGPLYGGGGGDPQYGNTEPKDPSL